MTELSRPKVEISFTSHWLPFWTLLKREILRFLRVSIQTLIAPTISTSLYLFIFGYSLSDRISVIEGFSFAQFVIPGLILMGSMNNAFQNASSSLFFARYIGSIVDYLVTPLRPSQFILAFTLAGMLRGCLVATMVFLTSLLFATVPWPHAGLAILMILLASFTFAQLGIIAAIYSNTFEHLAVFMNFLILPMTFLGGVFYPVDILPPFWQNASKLNPFLYVVNGFRYGALGVSEISPWISFGVVGFFAVTLFVWAAVLLKTGYKIRN